MANALFGHYHAGQHNFNSAGIGYPAVITQHHAMKKEDLARPHQSNLSKLELLQEDYRSRLLREKEQKLNALFEQKTRANLLPSKGSVREFFLNRRMLARSTKTGQNVITLPPIQSNSRYESVRAKKKRFVHESRLANSREAGKRNSEIPRQCNMNQSGDTEKLDGSSRELVKLRDARQKSQQLQGQESDQPKISKLQSKEKASNSTFAMSEAVNRMDQKDGITGHSKRISKSKEDYKRMTKPDHRDETNQASPRVNEFSYTKTELSKNLAKIKELSRRKTEEFLRRSMINKLALENRFDENKLSCGQPSPRKNSLKLEEMHRIEKELRETISRERKKLLVLQQRKREVLGETTREDNKPVHKGNGERNNDFKTSKINQYRFDDSTNELVSDRARTPSQDRSRRRPQARSTKPVVPQSTELKSEKIHSNAVAAIDLLACSNCGRRFVKDRISKHEHACKKASARRKRPFDARRKRAEGTEMEKYLIAGVATSDEPERQKTKGNWRTKHENFIQTIRYAKGRNLNVPVPLTNPDYIECSYCQRKFKPSVAERHIPRCKDIKARPKPPKRQHNAHYFM